MISTTKQAKRWKKQKTPQNIKWFQFTLHSKTWQRYNIKYKPIKCNTYLSIEWSNTTKNTGYNSARQTHVAIDTTTQHYDGKQKPRSGNTKKYTLRWQTRQLRDNTVLNLYNSRQCTTPSGTTQWHKKQNTPKYKPVQCKTLSQFRPNHLPGMGAAQMEPTDAPLYQLQRERYRGGKRRLMSSEQTTLIQGNFNNKIKRKYCNNHKPIASCQNHNRISGWALGSPQALLGDGQQLHSTCHSR